MAWSISPLSTSFCASNSSSEVIGKLQSTKNGLSYLLLNFLSSISLFCAASIYLLNSSRKSRHIGRYETWEWSLIVFLFLFADRMENGKKKFRSLIKLSFIHTRHTNKKYCDRKNTVEVLEERWCEATSRGEKGGANINAPFFCRRFRHKAVTLPVFFVKAGNCSLVKEKYPHKQLLAKSDNISSLISFLSYLLLFSSDVYQSWRVPTFKFQISIMWNRDTALRWSLHSCFWGKLCIYWTTSQCLHSFLNDNRHWNRSVSGQRSQIQFESISWLFYYHVAIIV